MTYHSNTAEKTNVLIIGYGAMGKNHGKALSELGITWNWSDIESDQPNLNDVSHVIISTPILSHSNVYKYVRSRFSGPVLVEKPITISRKNLEILRDPFVFPGLIERFNPAVTTMKSKFIAQRIDSIKFTRFVASATDNLFLEIGIHDLDLMCFFFDIQQKQRFKIEKFSMAKKTEYFLKGTIDDKIMCNFCWMVSDQRNRTIKTQGPDTFDVNLIEQKITLNEKELEIEKDQPLKLELSNFLNSGHINSLVAHEILVDILEEC